MLQFRGSGNAVAFDPSGLMIFWCQKLTVSCAELDELVDIARKAGALGAKMSGTGRGGLMLALTPTPEVQEAVEKALAAKAPQVWSTMLA